MQLFWLIEIKVLKISKNCRFLDLNLPINVFPHFVVYIKTAKLVIRLMSQLEMSQCNKKVLNFKCNSI